MVQALTITELGVGFRHAAQVAKIVRHRTLARTGKRTCQTVCVVTGPASGLRRSRGWTEVAGIGLVPQLGCDGGS